MEIHGSEFRDFLKNKLTEKISVNPRYSLRAFAKTLGVPASTISMAMSGKTPITLKFIERVGKKLQLDDESIQEMQFKLLAEKIKRDDSPDSYQKIDEAHFEVIKDWYHYAILNLMRTKSFQPSASAIAGRLGISLAQAEGAIERLQKVGLLEINGNVWKDCTSLQTSHSNHAKFNEAARENQRQLFDKARTAIDSVEFSKRNHGGVSIAINYEDLEKMKDYIFQFRRNFMKKFGQKKDGDDAYHLSVALFPLTAPENKDAQE